MIEAGADAGDTGLLSRNRLMPRWSADREARRVWISAGPHDDLAAMLAVAFAGLGARHVVLHGAGARRSSSILLHLGDWLDDVTLELRDCDTAPETLEVMFDTLGIDVYVGAAGDGTDEGGLAAASGLGIPAYGAAAAGDRIAFARGAAPLGGRWRAGGPCSLEAAMCLAGAVTHDFAFGHVMGAGPPLLPPGEFALDLSSPWDASDAAPLPAGRLPRALRVLVAGAGGLGCPAGLALSRRLAPGSRVVVADDDRVDVTNRNRQFLYSRADARNGVEKAPVLCRRLRALDERIGWVPVVRRCPHADVARLAPFDVVFTLTDSLESRVRIDGARVAPVLVNAAVAPDAATAALFHEASIGLTEALGGPPVVRWRRREPCRHAAPSIISTNLIGAALAVVLLRAHLHRGPAPARQIMYQISSPTRGGVWPPFDAAEPGRAAGA